MVIEGITWAEWQLGAGCWELVQSEQLIGGKDWQGKGLAGRWR
jgi:hypothetical protein